MSGIRSHSQYTVPDFVTNNLRKWESGNMYLSSYDKLSETNVIVKYLFQASAMKNSTEQILKTTSHKLEDRTPNSQLRVVSGNKIDTSNYNTHDYNNLYRTSYNDMDNKVKSII